MQERSVASRLRLRSSPSTSRREEALGLFREGAFTPATSNAHLAPNSQGAHFTDINGAALRCHGATAPPGLTPPRSRLSAGPPLTAAAARGDSLMWLHPGERPSAPNLEAAVSALQRLQVRAFPLCAPLSFARNDIRTTLRVPQADLGQMVALRRHTAEYQLAVYPGHGAKYTRHRDALPDDGSEVRRALLSAAPRGRNHTKIHCSLP